MVQQNPHEVTQLVASLESAKGKKGGKKGFSCKKTTFPVLGSNNIKVDSWRFQDWDYKRDDLPTYARGLFTTKNQKNQPEIAIRGYDKFFNVEEVNSTRWRNVENNTRGPYELSVKENGCIIFISGLEDGTLLVCSKHSTGPRDDADLSHAVAGERWVETHLASVGKKKSEFAKELRRMNATAVGELCDDRFEEHVLAYDEEASGIYLHGINYNLPEFATLPVHDVHEFADTWGFKKAQFVIKEKISEVKNFLEMCAETGSWNGRETEGFVIRCKMREFETGPFGDWFFKYKFEEPYLMYRQWREATKAMISGKPPRYKKHKKITEEYLLYARKEFAKNPQLTKLYAHNHGIISLRDGFLKERGLRGSEIIAMENAEGGGGGNTEEVTNGVVLVPVASIGCGKTTVAHALVKLFGWGHIQNDNIEGQKNRPKRFAGAVVNALALSKVAIADRNNHQRRERKQIIDDVTPGFPGVRFVALQYVHEPKHQRLDDIRKVTRQRVLDRGDNHQTIRTGTKSTDEIIGIMEGFLHRFEAVDVNSHPDSGFDEVIDLDITASSRDNLEKVISSLHSFYPKLMADHMPTSSDLDDAIDAALQDYSVETKHDLSFGGNKNLGPKNNRNQGQQQQQQQGTLPLRKETPEQLAKKIEYFNISVPTSQITSILTSLFPPSTDPRKAQFYRQLLNSRRIQPAFHVTLIHKASSQSRPDIWKRYTDLYISKIKESDNPTNRTPNLAPARVRIERLVWDSRIMAFVVRILPPPQSDSPPNGGDAGDGDTDQQDFTNTWPCANDIPHITVGTGSPNVKPKESNDLLKRWLEVGSGEKTGIWEAEVEGVMVLDGWVGEVLSRGK
ncbi:hypothetical protein FQN54_005696 [Arachnomyces sp. PD_36]|nr:hypothetical protein FQN54_005696 [Arachnomyces sp. PD_36]